MNQSGIAIAATFSAITGDGWVGHGAYAAKLEAFDGLMEVKSVASKSFVAECVESKSLFALVGHLNRIITNSRVESRVVVLFRWSVVVLLGYQAKTNQETAEQCERTRELFH